MGVFVAAIKVDEGVIGVDDDGEDADMSLSGCRPNKCAMSATAAVTRAVRAAAPLCRVGDGVLRGFGGDDGDDDGGVMLSLLVSDASDARRFRDVNRELMVGCDMAAFAPNEHVNKPKRLNAMGKKSDWSLLRGEMSPPYFAADECSAAQSRQRRIDPFERRRPAGRKKGARARKLGKQSFEKEIS